jgi:hypothetical protein
MADNTRAEDLVGTMERDAAFRADVAAAPTAAAKRAVLDAHGFADVGLDEMRAYVESKGGKLVLQQGGHELSDHELAAVAGGLTTEEEIGIGVGVAVGAATIAGSAAFTFLGIAAGAASAAV